MRSFSAFGVMMAVILLGLGLWTATPHAEIRPGGAHTVEVPPTGRFPFTVGGGDAGAGTIVVTSS